jgi:hypothetical protein
MSKSVEELAHEIVDDCYVTNGWGNSALDHVEFAKRIAKALSIQQEADAKDWVSVKDRLPECDTLKVIVWVFGCYAPSYMHVGVFRNGKWDVCDSRVNGITMFVTHWKPLPPAPNTAMATPTDSEAKTSA